MIDETDRKILTLLQEDARMSNAEVARQVDMAASAVYERIRKLEQNGVIRGYVARLDPTVLGFGLLAFVFVRADEGVGAPETETILADIPAVQEVHHIAGDDCFLVKVRAAGTDELGRLLRNELGEIPQVQGTRTTIVLRTTKEVATLPIVPDDATNPRADGESDSGDSR